jgi:L-threonylcarbamoyladenylate synthase
LKGRIDLVLDGGSCPGGIESTVLDLTTDPPTMLRPGLITAAAIEAVIGPIRLATRQAGDEMARSPGMLERHYAPEASLEMAHGSGSERVHALAQSGLRVGWISQRAHQPDNDPCWSQVEIIQMPYDSEGYALRLYEALHRLDEAKVDRIVVDALPGSPDWLAIRDRLRRASTA